MRENITVVDLKEGSEGVDLALDLVIEGCVVGVLFDTYVSHSETDLFVDSLATAMTGRKRVILESLHNEMPTAFGLTVVNLPSLLPVSALSSIVVNYLHQRTSKASTKLSIPARKNQNLQPQPPHCGTGSSFVL